MIELNLDTKIYLDYFPGRLKYANLENRVALHFEFKSYISKVIEVIQ